LRNFEDLRLRDGYEFADEGALAVQDVTRVIRECCEVLRAADREDLAAELIALIGSP
jgi:hypothetical protein